MAKKKIKTKKQTVESKLRDQVEHLTKSVQEANTRYYNLDQDFLKIARSVKGLFELARSIRNKSIQYDINRDIPYGRVRNTSELDAFEMLEGIKMSFLKLAEDFAREDEGTALLTEHKRDLMDVIGMVTNHDNRPSPKIERLAILSHNIELSKKDNRFLNVNDPDQYRHN